MGPFVQHLDTALDNGVGHEETRFALERSHERCRPVVIETPAGVTECDDTDGSVDFDAGLGGGFAGGEVVGQ